MVGYARLDGGGGGGSNNEDLDGEKGRRRKLVMAAAASDERTNAQCRASLCSCFFFLDECERGVGVETRVASLSPPLHR